MIGRGKKLVAKRRQGGGSFRMAGCAPPRGERLRLTAACSGSGKVTLAAATSGRRSREGAPAKVWPTGAED